MPKYLRHHGELRKPANGEYRQRIRKEDPVMKPVPIEESQKSAGSGSSAPQIVGTPTDSDSLVTVRGVLEKVSLVAAPPTLVIALAFWFGWTLTNARSAYFGIDISTLGFSTTDYLLRSADATFIPAAVTLLAILTATMLHGLVQHAITSRGPNAVVRAARGAATLGAILTFFAVWAMFEPLPVATYYLVPPMILGSGPPLIAYSVYILRRVRASDKRKAHYAIPSWERSAYVIAAMLALLGIFWASSLYAAALGRGRAQILAENLSSQPAVTVFSAKSLGIDAPGVTVTKIATASSAFEFRYSGLRLLIHSANKYFLVNDEWSHERGVTIVLQDTPDIRLEFTPGR
jgi:hypothetical protein